MDLRLSYDFLMSTGINIQRVMMRNGSPTPRDISDMVDTIPNNNPMIAPTLCTGFIVITSDGPIINFVFMAFDNT